MSSCCGPRQGLVVFLYLGMEYMCVLVKHTMDHRDAGIEVLCRHSPSEHTRNLNRRPSEPITQLPEIVKSRGGMGCRRMYGVGADPFGHV